MVDPLSLASTAIGLLKSTSEALSALRERAQRTKDLDIKDQINTMYDNVLSLKEVVSRLLDENKDLRQQLEQQQHPPVKPKIKQVGQTKYYFKDDEGPFCQPCYDVNPKAERLAVLSPQKRHELGGIYRDCSVCNKRFYESPNSTKDY
jgi:regulator of replication initiation timing